MKNSEWTNPPICPDCNGTGQEQIPCEPDEEDCEFCNGTGYLNGQMPQRIICQKEVKR